MPKKIKGGCQCRAVRWETSAVPLMAGHCNCDDCRKSTGGGHATVIAFPEKKVKITGKLKSYKSKTESGGTATRKFCPKCGGRISFQTTNWPGNLLMMAGSLDDPSVAKPGMAVYGKRRPAWDNIDKSIQTFDTMPPPQS
jgi:hypothetical protein